jgi:hypothetical protein
LKASLKGFSDQLPAQKRVIITKRGKPIAEVIPFEAEHEDIP